MDRYDAETASLGAKVDQERVEFAEMIDDLIAYGKHSRRPGHPFIMPVLSLSLLASLQHAMPKDHDAQLFYACNLIAEAVTRLIEQEDH